MKWLDDIKNQVDDVYRRNSGWPGELMKQADEGKIIMTSQETQELLERVRAGRNADASI